MTCFAYLLPFRRYLTFCVNLFHKITLFVAGKYKDGLAISGHYLKIVLNFLSVVLEIVSAISVFASAKY